MGQYVVNVRLAPDGQPSGLAGYVPQFHLEVDPYNGGAPTQLEGAMVSVQDGLDLIDGAGSLSNAALDQLLADRLGTWWATVSARADVAAIRAAFRASCSAMQ